MNLSQLHDTAALKSYFSRPDSEVWMAINAGSRFIYQAVLKEDQNYFRTIDSTSVTFQPTVQEYALPAAVGQILRVRERLSATDSWRAVEPVTLNSAEGQDDSPSPTVSWGSSSQFNYQGPYLSQTSATAGTENQVYSIFITPIPADTRLVEIVYTAKYIEVAGRTDHYMIPIPLRDCVLDLAVSELLRGNNDDLSDKYAAAAEAKMNMALTEIRDRQFQHPPSVRPYLAEFL